MSDQPTTTAAPDREGADTRLPRHRRLGRRVRAILVAATALVAGLTVWRGCLPDPVKDILDRISGPAPSVNEPAATPTTDGTGGSSGSRFVGWGPDRDEFTSDAGAPYAVLNSVTDNPVVGDERNFLVVKDAAVAEPGDWSDRIAVEDGHQYLLRIYVRNDGVAYNGDDDNPASWIHGATLSIFVPPGSARSHDLTGYLSADNNVPIWDSVTLISDQPFRVTYEPGNARLYSNAFPDPGLELSDTVLASEGIMLGNDEMNGMIRPGYEHALYITVTVGVEFD